MKSVALAFTKEQVDILSKFDTNFIALDSKADVRLQELNKEFKTINDYIKEEDIIKAIDQPIYKLTQNWINFKTDLKEQLTFNNLNLWEQIELNFELFLRDIAKYIEVLDAIFQKEDVSNIHIVNDPNLSGKILSIYFKQKEKSLKSVNPKLETKIKYHLIKFLKPIIARHQLINLKYSIPHTYQKKVLFIPNMKYDIQQISLVIEKLNSNCKPIILATSREICQELKKANKEFCTIKSFITKKIKRRVKWEEKRLNKILESLKQDIQFQDSFEYKEIKLWPLIKDEMSYIFKKHFPEVIENILVVEKLIRDKKIDIVVTCTDAHRIGRAITQTANKKNIPTLLIPHGNTDMRFAYIPAYAQKIAVWGTKSKQFYVKYGTDKSKLIITGCPRFDEIINRKFLKEQVYKDLNLDKNKDLIVFGTHVVLSSKPDAEKEIMFRSLIKIIKKLPNYQLVVKLHHADNREFYEKIAQETGHPEISIVKGYDLHNLLFAADLLVIKGSTIGIEALMLNTPVATIHLEQRQNKTPYVNSGAVVEIYKEEDIEKEIISALTDQKTLKNLKEKRKKFLESYIYKLDGKSSERVAKLIQNL